MARTKPPVHIAVCDDEAPIARLLAGFAEGWGRARAIPVVIRTFPSAEAFLFDYAEDKRCDILLLDIEMGRMNGVALAHRLRAESAELVIIFATGYMDYMSEGYEVDALHYLVKPIREEKLYATLDRALARIRDRDSALILRHDDRVYRIALREIRYITVDRKWSTVHTLDPAMPELSVRLPLSGFASELDRRFTRVGRALMLNMQHVQAVGRTCVRMSDGSELPLPRGGQAALNESRAP